MWEIISTTTGSTIGTVSLLHEAVAHVFRGGFFAHRDGLFLLRDPRDGRVLPVRP